MPNPHSCSNAEVQKIKRLVDDWALWRDTGQFDKLRACYAPDATVVTTWFDGPASDFVDASERSSGSSTLVHHFMGPSTIELDASRALAETRLMILLRTEMEAVPVDVTCYGRFCDRYVRIDDDWRLLSRMPVYEKDTVTPVDPLCPPRIDHARLMTYPAGFRHLAYIQAAGGAAITMRIPAHNSVAQRELYQADRHWLRTGS